MRTTKGNAENPQIYYVHLGRLLHCGHFLEGIDFYRDKVLVT